MYLVFQDDEGLVALCLTKTSANDIVKFINPEGPSSAYFAWVVKIEPVDLDQFVKNLKEEAKYLDAISGI